MLFGASVPALLLGPFATGIVATDPDTALLLFRSSALMSVGIFAGMPVLLAPAAAEIFGGRYSGEIYRRLWLTVPLANVCPRDSKPQELSQSPHPAPIGRLSIMKADRGSHLRLSS